MNSKYKKEFLQEIVKNSVSKAEVIRRLNLKLTGGNYRHIAALISIYNIDISHFTGQSWRKNKTDIRIKRLTVDSILQDKIIRRRSLLFRAMTESGIPYICSICKMSSVWMNKQLTLHIDHIDGNNVNNSIDNLRFLCPNCHQQTETWGNNKTPQ